VRTGRVAMARGARPDPSVRDRFAGEAEAENTSVSYSV
jgi:hypothetical protein